MACSVSLGDKPLLGSNGPKEPLTVSVPIDFADSALSGEYSGFFAVVIDDLLTPEECASLQAAAEGNWQPLSKGDAYRVCRQSLVFSHDLSSALFRRIEAQLPDDVKALKKGDPLAATIVGSSHLKANLGARKTVWRLKEANERLSFLHYQPGHFFKPHCDALYARDGKDEKSFLTCQIYLSDAPTGVGEEPSGGGETRFWSAKRAKASQNHDDGMPPAFLDVKPKVGRALVFQQRLLWHSGQEVLHGDKFTVRLDLMYERHFERL